jgi:hypothetical protein
MGLLVAMAGVVPAAAGATVLPGVRWAGGFGRTTAVAAYPRDLNGAMSGVVEAPQGYTVDWEDLSEVGRWSLRFAMLAPLNERVSVGAEVFADDIAVLVAALKATGEVPGTVVGETVDAQEYGHRDIWGLAWRVDADAWRFGAFGARGGGNGGTRTWVPPSRVVVTGTAGVWRVTADRLRRPQHEGDAFGWSLGVGWRFQLPGRAALGPTLRYCRVFDDRVGRYVTAGFDWGWR